MESNTNTELIHFICEILDIKKKKSIIIKNQRYEEAAKLRDSEITMISKAGDIMVKSGITKSLSGLSASNIEDIIKVYLENTYGVSYLDENTPKALKRQLKLEEIFKKD